MRTDSLRRSRTAEKKIRLGRPLGGAAIAASIAGLVLIMPSLTTSASAATAPVNLGVAASYSVIGAQTVTNTGPTTLAGDLGVSPHTAITGFPPGLVSGTTHAADAQAALAQSAVLAAWNAAAGRASDALVSGDLVGRTLVPGVYKSSGPLAVSGTLTLDAQGNPASVFVFQVASALTTATASNISMINGAQPCHVYWQIGSSATLGTASTFKGTILALASVTVTTGVHVEGRAFAHTGAVTLDSDVFTMPGCNINPVTSSATTTTPGTSSSGNTTSAGNTTSSGTMPTTGTDTAPAGGTSAANGGGSGTQSQTANLGGGSGTQSTTANLGGAHGTSTTALAGAAGATSAGSAVLAEQAQLSDTGVSVPVLTALVVTALLLANGWAFLAMGKGGRPVRARVSRRH